MTNPTMTRPTDQELIDGLRSFRERVDVRHALADRLDAAVAASGSPPSPEQLEAISNVINLIDRVEEMSPSDREIYRAGCDALNAIARASSGCTGAPPDTFRNTFRNPVAQALWGDKEKGK